MSASIIPLSLGDTAASIARVREAKGALVMTWTERGVDIGVDGLTTVELQNLGCYVIWYAQHLARGGV